MNLPQMRLWVDDTGRARAATDEASAEAALVASFIETDLQDPAYAARIIDEARRAARTRGGARWHTTGNAYALSIGAKNAVIEALHGADAGTRVAVPTARLVALIQQWNRLA